jgi:hypothetical protein
MMVSDARRPGDANGRRLEAATQVWLKYVVIQTTLWTLDAALDKGCLCPETF